MSAKDRFHDAVKNALIKEGWRITNDPLRLPIARLTNFYIDLGIVYNPLKEEIALWQS